MTGPSAPEPSVPGPATPQPSAAGPSPCGRSALTRPPGRYGTPRALSRPVAIVLGGVLATLLTAWAAWVGLTAGTQPVRWSTMGATIVDETRTDVTFEVTMDRGRRAVCTVRALNAQQTVVGLLDVTIGPSPGDTLVVTTRVPTIERATTGGVRACALS